MLKKISVTLLLLVITSITFCNIGYSKVYEFSDNNRLTLLQDSRASASLKINLVRSARSHIHIMTYYWDNTSFPIELMRELKNAHDRGVEVRIMTTYIPTLTTDFFGKAKQVLFKNSSNNESDAIVAFLELTPEKIESITDNIHEKIFLVDGNVAILGGRNISNNDFKAKDLEIKLEGPVVNQVQEHFRKMFSFLIDSKKGNICQEKKYCASANVKMKFDIRDKRFFPDQPSFEDGAKARIITNEGLLQRHNVRDSRNNQNIKDDIIDTVIQTDFKKIRAYNYFIIPTKRYRDYLEVGLAENKEIKIITNSIVSSKFISDKGYLLGLPEMKNLVNRGLMLHQWKGALRDGDDDLIFLHEKVMLFDDDHALIGSHNYGQGSSDVSSEIVIEFYSRPIVQTLINVFNNEFGNESVTKNATIQMLDREIQKNTKILNLLHIDFIKTIISDIY